MSHSYSPPFSHAFRPEGTPLSLLGDVHIDKRTVVNGQSLVYDSVLGQWTNKVATTAPLALPGLTDVRDNVTSAAVDGNFLRWSAGESLWVNTTAVLDDCEDVNFASPPTDGKVLTYEGATNKWIPSMPAAAGDAFNYVLTASPPLPSSSNGQAYFNPAGLMMGSIFTLTMTLETLNDKFIQQYLETLIVNDCVLIRKKSDPNTFLRCLLTTGLDTEVSAPPPAGRAILVLQVFGLNGTFVVGDTLEFIVADRSLPLWTGLDVDASVQLATTGQVLMWNDTTHKWEAQYVPTPAVALNDLTDVTLTSVAAGNIIQFDGSVWKNVAPAPTSAIYEYTVDTSVTAPPIATAKIVYNNAAQTTATVLYLSHITDLAQDIENFLSLYTTGTKLTVQDKNVSGNYQNWQISGAPTVTPTSNVAFPVTFLSSGGTGTTGFANNLKTVVVFTATSATGAASNTFREDTFLYTYHTANPGTASVGGLVFYTAVGPFSDTLAFTFQDSDGNNIKSFLSAVNSSIAKGTVWGLKKKNDVNTFVFLAVLSAAAAQSAPDPAGRVILTGTTLASHGTFTAGDTCELYINRVADFVTGLNDFDHLVSDFTDKATMIFDSATSKFKTISRSDFLTNPQLQGTVQIGGIGTGYTIPTSDGTAGQVLTADAAGTAYWNTPTGGTVTSVSALTLGTTGTDVSSSVATGTTTPVITLNIPTASASNRGALSAADWTTFNAKGSGTVTSVSALTLGTTGTDLSSTVATGTTTPVITLQVPNASGTNRGALTAADWTTFNGKQNALTLTTTGTSGAATLVGATLNIPQYSGGGGAISAILAAPYPIHRLPASITPATTQYYCNAYSNFTGTATSMRFMLYASGSDSVKLGIYRANTAWDIATATLIGQSALTSLVGYAIDTVHTLALVAESGQNLNLTAGENIILCGYINGTTNGWKGSTITSSTVAWQNTTDLTAPNYNFPTNPAAKATNSGTTPFFEVVGTI